MTYTAFLILFLVVPIGVLALAVRGRVSRRMLGAMGTTAVLALVYTAPWDNALIRNGVWSFGRSHVLGIVFGVVPLEEYVFYVLQVALTGLFVVWLLRGQVRRVR